MICCRYFDAHGNYYRKDDEEVQDTWLEGVDWNKVRSMFIHLNPQEPCVSRLCM